MSLETRIIAFIQVIGADIKALLARNDYTTPEKTKLAGLTAGNVMTTAGDTIYGGASGAPTRLAKGTDGQIMAVVTGTPAWIDSPYVLADTYTTEMGDIAAALAAILG